MKIFKILPIVLFIGVPAMAQFSITGGINYSNLRDKGLLENKESLMTYHVGVLFKYSPFKNTPKISFQNEILVEQRGYRQTFEDEYSFKFTYCTFPMVVGYSLTKSISIYTGPYISTLIDTNVLDGMDTYNHFDAGWILGFSFFDNGFVGLNARLNYGFLPMLDYQEIDALGNFLEEENTLRNLTVSVGIKINLH